ncbi:beta-agarase [Vibrio sp. A1-b2]|uniref:beta-agarase n=1 Tax=Vibrio sp. A1-b2 TaxID=2912248 RepID=UPI001F44F356|nr:beta-agarase [Vibrio sp. A1-b2]MCF7364429.1 beta-agarase [Vibrio sp. A1-b2]
MRRGVQLSTLPEGYGHFGSSTHVITSDVQTDGEKSMQANMGASYQGGVKIYAPNSWNWSEQKEIVFDVVNNTNEEINYGVKILTNYVWDDANALSEYFNVPANTVLENVVMSLDSTQYGSIGASYNKAMVMEINFFAAEPPNTTVYIDNIRVSDGSAEPPPPLTDPDEASGRISSAPVKTLLQLETFDEITDAIEASGADIVLIDEGGSIGNTALKTTFNNSWSSVKLHGNWDLSTLGEHLAIAVDVTNPTNAELFLSSRVEDNSGNDASGTVRGKYIPANSTQTVYVSVKDTPAISDIVNTLGMRELPAKALSAGRGDWQELNLAAIQAVTFFVPDLAAGTTEQQFIFDNARVIKDLNNVSAYEELVDVLGQNNQYDFYAKLEGSEDLEGLGERETQLLGRLLNRNQYGGAPSGSNIVADQDCKLSSPASFNACKTADGKWYLVDPDGHAFISTGLANIRMTDTYIFTGESSTTPSDVRKSMFTEIPANHRKEMGPVHSGPVEKGEGVSFYANNIDTRHGGEEAWQNMTIKRMQDWGFTSLGNWTDSAFYPKAAAANMSYVANGWVLHHETSENPINRIGFGYCGPIADPFYPNFALSAEKMAEKIKQVVTGHEATLMGIFVDNEISWGNCLNGDDAECYAQTLAAMNSDGSTSPVKNAFVWFLENGFGESKTIASFNSAWGTSLESWSDLNGAQNFVYAASMLGDLKSLNWQFANKYFEVVNQAVKAEIPNNLYLGAWFADWGRTPETVDAAKGHADVVSFNIYKDSITSQHWQSDVLEQIESLDFPAIIGEFHFGVLDSGNFATGIVSANSQQDRGDKYTTYMESVLDNDNFVGAHWFQYLDSPITGRAWDGENYNVGFVNVTDTPYSHLTDAARIVNCELYGDDCSALKGDNVIVNSFQQGI